MRTGIISFDPGRRALLGLLGGSAATAWARQGKTKTSARSKAPPCTVRPEQTEGPYFVEENLLRADLRSDPADGSLREGTLLRLRFHVGKVIGTTCTPLAGALVDLWHCDAEGIYSGVKDDHFDTRGRRFLRGHQLTDAQGNVAFTTIYPGWYPGRAVHIHFKIRTRPGSARGHEFTSQLYFDDALTDQVHAQAPYAKQGTRDTRNGRDQIFRYGGSQLTLPLARDGEGYAGAFDVGLWMG